MTDRKQYEFTINNMKCAGCVSAVESALDTFPGVSAYEISLENHSATVVAVTDAASIADAITSAGFPAELKQ